MRKRNAKEEYESVLSEEAREWEKMLEAEGLGVTEDIIRHTSTHVRIIQESIPTENHESNLVGTDHDYTSTSTFEHWYRLTHRANAILDSYKHKAFLIDCCETGNVQLSARKFGISAATAKQWFGMLVRGELEAMPNADDEEN